MKTLRWATIYYGIEGTRPELVKIFDKEDQAKEFSGQEAKRTGLNGVTNPNFYTYKPISIEILDD